MPDRQHTEAEADLLRRYEAKRSSKHPWSCHTLDQIFEIFEGIAKDDGWRSPGTSENPAKGSEGC